MNYVSGARCACLCDSHVAADNYLLCIVSTLASPPAISASLISCRQHPGDELQENNNLQDEWGVEVALVCLMSERCMNNTTLVIHM